MSEQSTRAEVEVPRPGRLGSPDMSLATDPRTDPRLVGALAPFGLDAVSPPPPVSHDSPREALLEFCLGAELGFEAVFAALLEGLPAVEGVTSERVTITAPAGHEITLHVHRPAGAEGPLPCVVHLHGGGMCILRAEAVGATRWRDDLAAAGLVVVGVEFRNGGGVLGPHPFPAGLDDCAAAVQWVIANRDALGVSSVVVSGESGGGNLTLAVTHRAKREGWLEGIDGVYAQCPFISNAWVERPAELGSLHENDGYFIDCAISSVMAAVYDPEGQHADDPECWPLRATPADLEGMPPHVISVNELDPLRDEGLAYYRLLLAAGVPTVGRTVGGTCHAGDVLVARDMPDVYAASVRDVKGFAGSF